MCSSDLDYTNYENSVKHLKEAGLNPALFYAKGGQGGATGGGQAQGVGLPSTTPTMARIQAQGMGAQLQNVLSQVELNKATVHWTSIHQFVIYFFCFLNCYIIFTVRNLR